MSALTAIELREMSTMLKAFFEKEYMEKVYPVGAIYLSVNDTDPSSLFGGTWERLKDRFLLGAGDTYTAGSEGGSADAVLLRHGHNVVQSDGGQTLFYKNNGSGLGGFFANTYSETVNTSAQYSTGNPINVAGGQQNSVINGTGKNMPPYLTVYMWKRTA